MAKEKIVVENIDTIKEGKKKALAAALEKIEKEYGKGAVMRLGEDSALNVESVSTGSLILDNASGVGGFPRGRIIEIFGSESSGKTTLALTAVAQVQKDGGNAAFIDAEHALDPSYASILGVDIDNLLVSQPDDGEQALEIAEHLIRSGAVDIIIVDSVAALVPRSEIEGEMGDSHVGAHARLMSQAMRKIAGAVAKSKCIVIFINQIREKIGVMYGNPETTTGGRALKFYATMRLDVRKTENIKDSSGNISGAKIKVKFVKNKVAPPFKEAEIENTYGKGFQKVSEIIDLAVGFGIIDKAGSWYSYPGVGKIGQGKENTKRYLEENPEFAAEIELKVKEIMKPAKREND